MQPSYVTVLFNRRYEAMESLSHVRRCSVDYNSDRMYVCVGERRKRRETDLMRVAASRLNVSASINSLLCEIVRSSFVYANIVFLVCLMSNVHL